MPRTIRIILLAALAAIALVPVIGCGNAPDNPGALRESPFATFRDIPGVTEYEIAAIEALQKQHASFIYGMTMTTESFLKENGEIGGYSALFCQWLSALLGIRFDLELFLWNELHDKLAGGEIDFSGHMMPDEESLQAYYMTGYIATRQFIIYRLKGSCSLKDIQVERPLRFAFTENSPTEPAVARVTKPGAYEPVWIGDYADAYPLLVNGEVDAFITTSAAEVYFIEKNDLVFEDFFPLIFNPVSLATAKP